MSDTNDFPQELPSSLPSCGENQGPLGQSNSWGAEQKSVLIEITTKGHLGKAADSGSSGQSV